MQFKFKEGIEWLEFDQLQGFQELRHAVFLRSCGDCKKSLPLLMEWGVQERGPGKQVHGKEVTNVEEAGECDGVVTNQRKIALAIRHADCQAAIFFDPIRKVIANVHSGWRGSVKNIYGEAIEKMRGLYGSNPADVLVSISPSLGPEWAEFIDYRRELPEAFWSFQKQPNYFDFWEISREQLKARGVLEGHIEVAEICTYERKEWFFSYRRESAQERNATVVALI